ncbi:MAG TPA: hypothetical protein VNA27_01990 [Rubrobacteraceae bacterium]|nr:hypothetical protein [Rubrobacteraceae bacterium]
MAICTKVTRLAKRRSERQRKQCSRRRPPRRYGLPSRRQSPQSNLPATDEQTAESIAGEVLVEPRDGPVSRVVATVWRPGDDGEAVIARIRLATG